MNMRDIEERLKRLERDTSRGSRMVRMAGDDGGGGGCDTQNAIIDVIILGKPTGGTFALTWTVDGTTTQLTSNWNDSSSSFATTLATHAGVASTSNVTTSGTFPNMTMRVEFIGAHADTNIPLPVADWASLTGGTGVGIICALAQLGHA